MSDVDALKSSLREMLEMHDALCKKINWGSSFLDGKTIQLMNEVPANARRLLEKMA